MTVTRKVDGSWEFWIGLFGTGFGWVGFIDHPNEGMVDRWHAV